MSKKNLSLTVVAGAVIVAAVAWALLRGKAESSAAAAVPAGPAPQSVTVAQVLQRDVPVAIEATGTVVSLNTVDVRPQVSSTIRTVAIKEGQFVKKGDLLFAFDDRPDRANLEKARAQLARDRATMADLERQWARAQDLRAQNFIAQSAADTVLSQLESQRALLRSDEAAVHASEVALGYNQVRSPLSGRAGAISVYPGSLVSPTGNPLVTISQVDPIGVSFTVPEGQLSALLAGGDGGAGASIGVRVPADRNGGTAGAQLEGRVSFVDNSVDASSGTIRVKGELPNARQQLWPGQFVNVQMTLRTLKDAVVVPQAALILRGQERSVYVVDTSGTAQLRKVQQRYAAGDSAVVDGLKAGETVVLEGKQNLRPGTPVRAASAAAVAASGAAAR